MAIVLGNRAKMSTSTTGTGTITLGSALSGYQTFAQAGITNGQTVRYTIEDGTAFEIGSGVFTSSGTTLTRNVTESSNSDNAINLSGNGEVFITAAAADIFVNDGASNLTTTGVGTFASLDISGNIDVDGITNLDVVDIDGAVNIAADLTIASTNKILFNDASQFIQGSSATVLTIAATDEIDLTATTIDINGAVALNGAVTGATNVTLSGELDAATGDFATSIAVANVGISTGVIDLKNGGSQSYIRFYCESNNEHYAQLQAPAHGLFSGNVTLTLPATTDTVAGIAATQTFTNKTLTAPKIADGGFIADANGNQLIVFQTTGSAVNELEITNNASGSNPIIAATGGDTNIGIALTPKGTGEIVIAAGNLNYAGTAITTTGAEINLIDGGTSRGTTAVASGDGILINDAGTMRMTNVDTVSTYFSGHSVGGGNIVTTGALNSGSITSGFGAINNGASNITTTGVGAFGSLDISGAIDVDGTTNLDVVDIDGAVDMASTLLVAGVLTANAGAVFNEGSADVDFRVESNGNANMVFVDGGNDKVAIGTATATAMLTVAGSLKPITYQETYIAKSAASTVTCDLATGTSFSVTLDQNTTFAFTNPPGSGTAFSFTLFVTQHSTAVTLTWPNTVDWAGGSAPDAAGNNAVQAYAFFTRDGGTTYYGFLGGTAIA